MGILLDMNECPLLKRESKWQEKEWGSHGGSDRPPIGLCLSVIRGRLPVPTRRSIVINTPHRCFSHSSSPALFFCLLSCRGGGGVWPCMECWTETNARVYLQDISSNILLWESAHADIFTRVHAAVHTISVSDIPLLSKQWGGIGGRGGWAAAAAVFPIKCPLLKGRVKGRVGQCE